MLPRQHVQSLSAAARRTLPATVLALVHDVLHLLIRDGAVHIAAFDRRVFLQNLLVMEERALNIPFVLSLVLLTTFTVGDLPLNLTAGVWSSILTLSQLGSRQSASPHVLLRK